MQGGVSRGTYDLEAKEKKNQCGDKIINISLFKELVTYVQNIYQYKSRDSYMFH